MPAGVAGAAENPDSLRPVEGAAANTTRMLHLDRVETEGFGSGSPSVTDAVEAEAGTAEVTLDRYALDTRLARAAPGERERLLNAALNRSERRIRALSERERLARERLRAGDVGIDCYLAVLGSVNREARAVEVNLDRLERVADSDVIEDRVNGLQTDTARYVGPVADELGAALVRGATTDRVSLAVADHGFAVAAIREGEYVREITRTDARDETVGGVDLDAAQTRIGELYPWAWANKGDVSINTVGEDVFRFQLAHDHGELTTLLDTSAGTVYREVQQKSLAGLPVAPGPSATSGNLTLSISTPDPGTPLRVQVTNATGARVPASVSVNGTYVGQTGPGGSAWALTPAGNFTVTAQAGDQPVELAVAPK